MRDKLSCKITQLSTIHASPPCTSYTDAHHGKSPHRYKTKPTSDLARKHDCLNTNLFNVLRQASVHCYCMAISIENPVCIWQYMPFVRQLLNSPGWFKRTADHCMHRRAGERMFPRKRSTWLLFNVDTDIPLRKCDGTCGCTIPGTPFHKWLVCNRADKHPDQEVLGGGGPKAELAGLIPHGLFDLIEEYRLRARDSTANPNKFKPIPSTPLNEILVNTHRARDTDIVARCNMVDGMTYSQCAGMQYTTKLGTRREYTVAHLQDDLRRGFLRLKSYITQHNAFTVKDAAQLAHLANKDLNDLVESIAHIHCGDDPTSEKEALAGPDAKEWRKSMRAELDALVALGCWTYKPKHLKPAGKKVFRGKMVLKTKPPANGQPARKKSRYVISDPKFLQKLTDVDCFSPMCRLEWFGIYWRQRWSVTGDVFRQISKMPSLVHSCPSPSGWRYPRQFSTCTRTLRAIATTWTNTKSSRTRTPSSHRLCMA